MLQRLQSPGDVRVEGSVLRLPCIRFRHAGCGTGSPAKRHGFLPCNNCRIPSAGLTPVPLPASPSRKEIHLRQIEMRGFLRDDGLYEIEGRVTDTKPHDFMPDGGLRNIPAGEPLHDMWIRLVIDENMLVHDALAVADAHPYRQCPEASAALARLKGLSIVGGWAKAVNERIGRAEGCTHQRELLLPLASAAFQALTVNRAAKPAKLDASGRPVKLDSCYAYASDGELVLKRFPAFHKPRPEPEPV